MFTLASAAAQLHPPEDSQQKAEVILLDGFNSCRIPLVSSYQGSCSVEHGLVRQEVLLGSVVAAVGQFIVLNQEAQVGHLPDLQLRGLWRVSVIREAKSCLPELKQHSSKQVWCRAAYRRPEALFGSLMPFSGALLPPNHFLVAVKRERLKPFLEISCGESSPP